MKQLFAAVFFLVIGGGLFYWYQTGGYNLVDNGEITTALPNQYMKVLREEPQTLDDIVELTSSDAETVQESLDYMMGEGRVKKNSDGLYYAE